MPKRLELVGKKFGMLTVLDFYDVQHGMSRWKCRCDCGNETIAYGNHMLSGNTVSCGCYGKEKRKEVCTKHNDCYSRLYRTWADMKNRCNNEKSGSYKWYGGKGITYAAEWESFEGFKAWALSVGYNDSLTIDRIDSDGNYCPENCQWIPFKDNLKRMLAHKSKKYWGENLKTGERYEFIFASEFAKEHSLNPRNITAVCRGERETYGDWIFGNLT